ncbi:MAG TPA: oligosaccharide flippase family protein [Coriobacteriia bacterium]
MAKNVARGSLLGMAAQGWHMVTAFLLYAYLARQLGPVLFGEWRVVLSLLAWFEVFVTSAVVRVATKAISEAPDDAPRLARAAWVGQAVVAGTVFVAVEIAAGPVALVLAEPALAPLIRIAALDIPLYGAFVAASATVLGLQRYERQAVAWLVYATAKAVLIAALVVVGFSLAGALVGNALSSLVGLAAMFVATRSDRSRPASLWPVAASMLVASVPFLALSLIEGVGQHVDLWLVSGLVADRAPVGLYAAATVLAEVPVFLFLGLNRVIFPSVARARAEGDPERADAYATQAVRTAVIVTVMAVAFVAASGREAIRLVYSSAYVGAFVPLVLLMAAGLGRTVQATCTEVLMAEGRRRAALGILASTVVLQVALVAQLIARFGMTGAAAGTAVSALVAALACGVALRRSVGWRPLATLARSAVAAAAVGAVLLYAQPSAAWLLAALPVAVAAYMAALAGLREFSSEDVASMRAAIGR